MSVANEVYNGSGVLINNVGVLYCRTMPEVSTIINRTQAGLWFCQTTGDSATKAEVQLLATGMTARDDILNVYGRGALLSIRYDGHNRTGYINGEPSIELLRRGELEERVYRINFNFAVDTEVEI